MHGQILYPLNALQAVSVDHYHKQRAKYTGRETLMRQPVPPLNCLWNDVLHLCPIQPAKLAACAKEAGLSWQEAQWFEIDPAAMRFNAENTAIFCYQILDYGDQMDPSEFQPFESGCLEAMSEVRQSTRDYYKSIGPGGRYLLFVGVPHVLHKGMVNVETALLISA
jgi:hypothetical protein